MDKNFYKMFKIRRILKNLTLENLSELTGVTIQTLHNIENWKTDPSFETVLKICNALL